MNRTKTLLSVGFIGLLVFLYFYDIIFSNNLFTFRDLSRYYYPLRLFTFDQIKAGTFPFWNPFIGSGHPLFATLQSVVLYPMSLIYLLPDFDFVFNFFIIFHIFLAGIFFYSMMREFKFTYLSSLISAVVFMFGGYLIAVINLTTTLAAAVWFPVVFIFFNRAIEKRRFVDIFLAALFLGLMFLGGEPTPFYSTVFVLGFYSLWKYFKDYRQLFKSFVILLSLILLFLLLFSFQIIPFVELINLSNRSQSTFEATAYWSFHPRDIINFVLPFFYGSLQFQGDSPYRQDWLLLTYLGIIPIILFTISLFLCRDRLSNFFKVTFILGLILIMGKFTPIYKILFDFIPGFGLIRYPVKFFFLSALSFAFLCGAGWERYFKAAKANDLVMHKFIKRLLIVCFAASLVFLFLNIFKGQIFNFANKYITGLDLKEKFENTKYFMTFNVDFFNIRRMIFFFIAGSLALFLGFEKKRALVWVGVIVIFLIFIDLYGGKNIEVNPAIDRKDFHKQTPNIVFLQKDKSLFRVYTSPAMNKLNETLRGNSYEEAFAASIDSLCPNRLVEYKLYDARIYCSIHNLYYSKVLNLVDTAPLPSCTNILNMLNVKYIVTPKEMSDKRARLVNKGINSFVYENLDCLPRAYLADNYTVLSQELDIANKLKSKGFNPKKEAIVEYSPLEVEADGGIGFNDPIDKKEHSEILYYSASEIIIAVNVINKPKFLVLSDNYYPGWKVFVDGKQEKIYKTNYTLRGVYLTRGRHLVKFIFDPVSFKFGSVVSLLTFIISIIFIIKLRNGK